MVLGDCPDSDVVVKFCAWIKTTPINKDNIRDIFFIKNGFYMFKS